MIFLKTSAKLAFSLLFFLFAFSTIVTAEDIGGPKPPVRVNWLNSMGCDMTGAQCVYLTDPQNTIQFVLRIRFSPAINDLSPYPIMQFYYNIGNGQLVGYTDPAKNDDIVTSTLYDGTVVNEVSYAIDVSVNDLCTYDDNFAYNIQYHFVDGGTLNAYPIYAYPDLFPPSIFDIPQTQAEYQPITLVKNICCFNNTNDCGGGSNYQTFSSQNKGETKNETSLNMALGVESHIPDERFVAYPNPFQNTIQLDYRLENAGKINVICLDANGKRMVQQVIRHESEGDYSLTFSTADWPAGIYFVRLLKGNEVQALKVMKLNH